MKLLRTDDRKVAEEYIKNKILREVRCIQSRVEARKDRDMRRQAEEENFSDQGVNNDRVSGLRTPSVDMSVSPSRRGSPTKTVPPSAANITSVLKSSLKKTDMDKTMNSFNASEVKSIMGRSESP